MLLDRKLLLTKEKLQVKKVDLGNGDHVFVKQMTGRERDLFEQSLRKEVIVNGKPVYKVTLSDFRAKLATATLCDASGNMLLLPNDYEALSTSMSAAKLELIVNTAQELNKISEEDKEALTKNSEAVQNGNSISDCVEN